jgi:hypothetical protein
LWLLVVVHGTSYKDADGLKWVATVAIAVGCIVVDIAEIVELNSVAVAAAVGTVGLTEWAGCDAVVAGAVDGVVRVQSNTSYTECNDLRPL